MPIDSYPFLRRSPKDLLRPMLIVKITNPQTGLTIDTNAIIDTGSDTCAIPASFCSILGYDFESGQPKYMSTGNGVTMAYSHQCRIDIYNTDSIKAGNATIIYTTSERTIDFMKGLPVVLLGVSDFLGQFFLGIDYRSQKFSIRQP